MAQYVFAGSFDCVLDTWFLCFFFFNMFDYHIFLKKMLVHLATSKLP
jgi:hypothetical protein